MGIARQGGQRQDARNFSVHEYYLRSASASHAVVPSPYAASSEASGSPRSDRSGDSPNIQRTLKKKSSIWNLFSRGGSKKTKPETMAQTEEDTIMALPNESAVNVNMTTYRQHPFLAHGNPRTGAGTMMDGTQRTLRTQQSMHTLRSQTSTPTLRSARSQYALRRRPSGMQIYDNDSIFSDESEGESVSVSWITSTGLKRAGVDEDDEMTLGR